MNRFIAILSLFLLLCPIFGYVGFFKLRQQQVRHAFKEKLEHRIPRSELQLLKIPQRWLEKPPPHFRQVEKNEFRLDGIMYDIVQQEVHGDTLWNYCLEDTAETRLFAHLDDWVQQQSTHDPFQRGQTLQWERLLHSLFQTTISDLLLTDYRQPITDWPPYQFNPLFLNLETISPPPR